MTTEQMPAESPSPRAVLAFDASVLASFGALLVIVAVLAFWLGARQNLAPSASSPDVGFARDMMRHHAQAVDMATLLRDRTDDPEMRQLALDIMLTQQAQIGQMQGWLTVWNLPIASTDPAMAWMGMPVPASQMPGLIPTEEVVAFYNLDGSDLERRYLELLVEHHLGGVHMAEWQARHGVDPTLRDLAGRMLVTQRTEIDDMRQLLGGS